MTGVKFVIQGEVKPALSSAQVGGSIAVFTVFINAATWPYDIL